ncbi:hypothetical protein NMY22_g4443 [Coprinellus aureogranulatus]|nr:hypothetical protein NMY22_g4443 [Coprinellus aureogranulatus]
MVSLKSSLTFLVAIATFANGAAITKRQDQDLVECTFNISTQETFEAWEIDLSSQFNQAVIIPVLSNVPSGRAWNRGAIITESDFDNKKWVFNNIVSAEGWSADETKAFLDSLEGTDVQTVQPPHVWHYDAISCALVA